MRSENITLEHSTKQRCNELVKNIMDSLSTLEKEFKSEIKNDKKETDFLKSQVNELIHNKNDLQKNVLSINTRLTTCENDVGMP